MTSTKRGDYADHWSHIKSKHLVHAAADFIVFIDDDLDLDWETSPDYDKAGHKTDTKHYAIMNQAAFLEATPCPGMASATRLHFKRLIGEAVARSFGHDYVSASKMLEAASKYVEARSQETSRLWYLSASFAMTALFIVSGIALWLIRSAIVPVIGSGMLWLAFSAIAGAMGALLSVISRTGKLRFNCSSGMLLHYLEGASRIWAGGLSGIVVALAIRTEMFLAPLARGEKLHAVMMIAGFSAGAVERLATSIISRVEANSPKTDREVTQSEDLHGSE